MNRAVRKLKNGKAGGVCGIQTEISEGWRPHNGAVVERGPGCGMERWEDSSRMEGGHNYAYS